MRPWVTGPVDIFVGLGSGGGPLFLGHDERMLAPMIRPYYSPHYSSLGGEHIPMDMTYDGQDAMVSVNLTRFNEAVYLALASRAPGSRASPVVAPGVDLPGDLGSLVILEGVAFQLWLRFPYSAKPAMAGMPAGYRFPKAYVAGPDTLGNLGTGTRRTSVQFHCLRETTIVPGAALGGVFHRCYDFNMSALPVGIPLGSNGV